MSTHRSLELILISTLLAFAGCAPLRAQSFVVHAQRPLDAVRFLNALDEAVRKSEAGDASSFRVPRFPYLRANRFLAALKNKIHTNGQRALWVQRMKQLGLEARGIELANLPESSVNDLALQFGLPLTRSALMEKASSVSTELLQHDENQSGFYSTLQSSLNTLPGEYSFLRRVIGIYPLFALPVTAGTESAHKDFKKWHNSPLEKLPVLGEIKIYVPQEISQATPEDIRQIFRQSQDAFGLPQMTPEEIKRLFAAFAPVYHQDTVKDYDRFAEVIWEKGRVNINLQRPIVYYYLSNAFIAGNPVAQLNYVTWYQGRYGNNAPWIERGRLDGLTVRITLDTDGRPVMMDTTNNCGCYHFFVPKNEKIKLVGPDAFVPTWLPEKFPSERLHLRVNSGWHQIQHVDTIEIPSQSLAYELVPYETLESLQGKDGRHESVFTPRGIMKDSSRIEPLFFFSSGIPAIGLMRERGHHAIKMVGREYFDNPELFDRNFIFN